MQGGKVKDIPEALRTSVTEESQTPLEKTEAPDSSSREDPNEVFKENNEDEKMIPKAEKLEKKQEAKTSLVSAAVTSADASSHSNVCATSGDEKLDEKMSSSNGNSFGCPVCKNPSTIPGTQDTFFNVPDYQVTLSDGTKISFEEATTQYLDRCFPDLEKQSYNVPPVLLYKLLDESLDSVTDCEVPEMAEVKVKENQERKRKWKGPKTPEEIMNQRRQKRAEADVAFNFFDFGKEILEPMFILTGFGFLDFARNSEGRKSRKQKNCPSAGDYDVLIISRREGVIFIEVKSVENTETRTCSQALKKAFTEQLPKYESAMRKMNKDLPFIRELPMQMFAGLPNVTDEQLSLIRLCKFHRDATITSDKLKKEQLQKFLSEKFTKKVKNEFVLDIKQYKDLVGRYVGLVSSVQVRTVSKACKMVEKRVSRILLNQDQLQCLQKKAKKNIILGHFGTGKSLVLMKKAEKLAEEGEKVYVLSFSCVRSDSMTINPTDKDNLVDHLQLLLKSKDEDKNPIVQSLNFYLRNIDVEFSLFPDLVCNVLEKLQTNGKVHFFLDEVPLSVFGGWELLENFCERNKSMFMWIVISSYSVLPKEIDFRVFDYMDFLPKSFEKTYFNRWMRVPQNIYQLIQTVKEFSADNDYLLGSHGNVLTGPRSWWIELNKCLCGKEEAQFECSCLAPHRLRVALKEVLLRLNETPLNNIAILVPDKPDKIKQFLIKNTEDACKGEIAYRVCAQGLDNHSTLKEGPEEAISIGDVWSLKGNEFRVVIFLDPFSGQLLVTLGEGLDNHHSSFTMAASRCLAHFIIITWPQTEKLALEKGLPNVVLSNKSYVEYNFYSFVKKGQLPTLEENVIRKVSESRPNLIEKF